MTRIWIALALGGALALGATLAADTYTGSAHADEQRMGGGEYGGHGRHHGSGHRSGHGHGRGHGQGHGHHPTLVIDAEGFGFRINFACNAEMIACLEAIDRVYEAAGEARLRNEALEEGDGPPAE